MYLSILIISFNTREYLRSCLHSIYQSKTEFDYEVIVVDNNSKDETNKMLVNEFSQVKLIRNKFNYGFSVAMNQAFRLSAGQYVMSFNPDAEVYEDTFQSGIEYLEAHPKVGKIGLATLEHGVALLPYFKFEKFPIPHLFKMFGLGAEDISAEKPLNVSWIFGTGLIIRRTALPLDRIYNEDSFLFWEEYGLSQYIRDQGFELHVLPHVKIMHHASVTFRRDVHKVFWARLLSHAHEWRIRNDYYGWWNARVNSMIFFADNFLIYLLLTFKSAVSPYDAVRDVEMTDRSARFRSGFRVLFSSAKSVRDIDLKAKIFFNGGVSPPYPPVVNQS